MIVVLDLRKKTIAHTDLESSRIRPSELKTLLEEAVKAAYKLGSYIQEELKTELIKAH